MTGSTVSLVMKLTLLLFLKLKSILLNFLINLLSPCSSSGQPDTALVLYRSPESMGLPKLERQKQEDMKVAMRKRIQEKRRAEEKRKVARDDGYEADAEDFGDSTVLPPWHQQNILMNGLQQESYGRGFLSGGVKLMDFPLMGGCWMRKRMKGT